MTGTDPDPMPLAMQRCIVVTDDMIDLLQEQS